MHAELSGKFYDIAFKYEPGDEGKYKNCIITTCFISYVDPAKRGPEQYTHLATGKARRNIIDPPNRGVGRRKALGDALKRSRFFNKSERVKLWEWYFQNHSDKVQTINH